jgi:hypothetical protein
MIPMEGNSKNIYLMHPQNLMETLNLELWGIPIHFTM